MHFHTVPLIPGRRKHSEREKRWSTGQLSDVLDIMSEAPVAMGYKGRAQQRSPVVERMVCLLPAPFPLPHQLKLPFESKLGESARLRHGESTVLKIVGLKHFGEKNFKFMSTFFILHIFH